MFESTPFVLSVSSENHGGMIMDAGRFPTRVAAEQFAQRKGFEKYSVSKF